MNRTFQTPPVVLNLIIINVLVYMATALLPLGKWIFGFGSLFWVGNPLFHTYQFVTYMFLHANFEHVFFNMFALWMFGRTLEYELGAASWSTTLPAASARRSSRCSPHGPRANTTSSWSAPRVPSWGCCSPSA